MENWISGSADRTRQHDAAMAFMTIKFTIKFTSQLWLQLVTCDRVTYGNTPYGPIVAVFLGNLGEYENVDRYVNYH